MPISGLGNLVLVLIAVVVIAFVIGNVFHVNIASAMKDTFFSQFEHKYIINLQTTINSDRTVKLTWETKEKGYSFVIYEMLDTKPLKEPSGMEDAKAYKVPKSDKEKLSWTSAKLEAGSHFYIIVPKKGDEEITEESSELINANFYDENYIEFFNDKVGDCEVYKCGVYTCKKEFVWASFADSLFTGYTPEERATSPYAKAVSKFQSKYPGSSCLMDSGAAFGHKYVPDPRACTEQEFNDLYYFSIEAWPDALTEFDNQARSSDKYKLEQDVLSVVGNFGDFGETGNPVMCRDNLKLALAKFGFAVIK